MGRYKFSSLIVFSVLAVILLLSGCVAEQEYKDLKVRNDMQRQRIAELESESQAKTLELGKLQRELGTVDNRHGVETDALKQRIAALEEDIAAIVAGQ